MRNKIEKTSKSKLIFLLGNSFILGIFFAPSSILLGFFFLFLLFFIIYPVKDRLVLIFCVLSFVIGSYYFNLALYNIPQEVEVPLVGVVDDMPTTRGKFKRLILNYQEGRALLYVDRYEDYNYGDILKVKGRFVVPEEEGYRNYLRKDGIYHTAFYPQIEKVGEEGNIFYKAIYSTRERAQQNIRKSLPAPQVFLLEAMILGDRTSFPDSLNEKLSISGTRHITAISGMHIVIISGMLFYLFLLVKIKKRKAALFSIFFIFLFVLFVGAPASAIRAGIMGSAVLLSSIFHERVNSFRLISLVAFVMLLFNPLLLHYDLGFQLSFLAVIGILSFHQKVKMFLLGRGDAGRIRLFLRKNEVIVDLLAVTISAQILVSPLVLYNFGHLSLLSIPANILIVPLLPAVMLFGIFTAISGSIIFSFFVYMVLSCVVKIIDFFYYFPFAALYIEEVPISLIYLLYLIIFFFMYKKRESFDFLR